MTNYLIKKTYGLETGPYTGTPGHVVVVDVVNHVWHRSKQLHTAIADPFVVYRSLDQINTHSRMMMRLSEFKTIFSQL